MNCLLATTLAALGGASSYANLPKSKQAYEKLIAFSQVPRLPEGPLKLASTEIANIPSNMIYAKPPRPKVSGVSDLEVDKDGIWKAAKQPKNHGVLQIGYKKPEKRTFSDVVTNADLEKAHKGSTVADVDRMNGLYGFDKNTQIRFVPNPPEIFGKEVPAPDYNRAMSKGEIYMSNWHDVYGHVPGYARLSYSPSWPKTKDILQKLFKIYDDPLSSAELKKRALSTINTLGSRIDDLTAHLTLLDDTEVRRQIRISEKAPWRADTYIDALALREEKLKDLETINATFDSELNKLLGKTN